MGTFVTIAGSVALVLAALLTMLQLVATNFYTMRAPSGPDSMGLVLFFFLAIGIWGLLLVGVLAGASRGGYAWASMPGLATVLTLIVACIGLGIVGTFATFASMETKTPARTLVGLAGAFVLPMTAIAFAGACLAAKEGTMSGSRWAWWFAGPLGAVALGGLGGAGVVWVKSQQARAAAIAASLQREREQEVARAAEQSERDQRHGKELAALPEDAPLSQFVTHLFIDKSDAHHVHAMARIRALRGLTDRLEEALRDPDPLQREYILNFIRVGPEPDAEWAPLVGRSIEMLAADLERMAKAGEGHAHPDGMTIGALMTAQRFRNVRFEREAGLLRAAIERWPGEGARARGVKAVDQYLAGEAVGCR